MLGSGERGAERRRSGGGGGRRGGGDGEGADEYGRRGGGGGVPPPPHRHALRQRLRYLPQGKFEPIPHVPSATSENPRVEFSVNI